MKHGAALSTAWSTGRHGLRKMKMLRGQLGALLQQFSTPKGPVGKSGGRRSVDGDSLRTLFAGNAKVLQEEYEANLADLQRLLA